MHFHTLIYTGLNRTFISVCICVISCVDNLFHIHKLRHTHATEVIGNGGNIKAVSQRLGHKDIRTTLNVYTAALSKNDAAIAAMFEKDE